jgi:hypothetical protein
MKVSASCGAEPYTLQQPRNTAHSRKSRWNWRGVSAYFEIDSYLSVFINDLRLK